MGSFQDLRILLRRLLRAPGFTLAVTLTFALGLGATTAIYSVVDAVLLRPLPHPEAERLVRIWHFNTRIDEPRETVSFETFVEMGSGLSSLDGAVGISPNWSFTVGTPSGPERIQGYWVSHSFFPLMGAEPAVGRGFLQEEDRPGGTPVAVISASLRDRVFGEGSDAVGRSVVLGPDVVTVVGVMQAGFRFGEPADVWLPLSHNPLVPRGRQVRWVDVVGRLAPGIPIATARDEIAALMATLESEYPDANAGLGSTVETLHTAVVGEVRPALWALLGGVVFVLLLASANVTNLLLGRASARRAEFAVRSALGATGLRTARQLLAEGVVLSLMGAALGTLLAFGLVQVLKAVGPAELPRLQEVSIDPRILLMSLALALVVGGLVGLAPGLAYARNNVSEALGSEGRSVAGGSRRVRSALVASQVAIAIMLLSGAGLLLRSFDQLMQVDPGFRTEGVLTLQVALPEGYDPDRTRNLYDALFDELEALPGVRAAGGVTRLPLGGAISTRLEIQGRVFTEAELPEVQFRRATSGYFEAMGIPIVEGRGFDARDHADASQVMLVSEATAEALWPGADAMGQLVRFWFAGIPDDAPWVEVVGVTGGVREFGLATDAPAVVFVPFSQGTPPASPLIAVAAETDPLEVVGAVRDRIRALEPATVIWDVRTMADRVSESVAGPRFNAGLMSVFGLAALLIAGVGVYGVIAYGVRRRGREIGVRIALGATAAQVVRLVFRQGVGAVVVGSLVGLAGAVAAAQFLRGLLFGVGPFDPWTFLGATLLLLLVAASAIWIPARRAAALDPLVALRAE